MAALERIADSRSQRVARRIGARWRATGRTLLSEAFYLRVDDHDSLGLLRSGTYEPYETSLLLSLITPGSTVLDIGANIGFHTVQFAHAVGPAGRVIAFEPDPDNLRLLEHNLRTNGVENVVVIPKAAADVATRGALFRSSHNHGDHRLYDSGDGRERTPVDLVTVDETVGAIAGAVSLIKLDIQGSEPRALRGMQSLLHNHPEAWIATEFWPLGLRLAGSSAAAYLEQLRATGAALLRIDEDRHQLAPLDPDWLNSVVTVERGNHTNFLLPSRAWVRRDRGACAAAPMRTPSATTVMIGDRSFDVSSGDRYLDRWAKGFEPDLLALFNSLVTPHDVVFDIGANVGLTALHFGSTAARVVAFEPSPTTFGFLTRNVERSGLTNIETRNIALGAQAETSTLTFSPTNRSGAFVSDRARVGAGHVTETIEIQTLDAVMNSLSSRRIDFMKIDVEGFEPQVVEGGRATIAASRPIAVLEMNHWCLNAFHRTSIPDFLDFLMSVFPILYAVDGHSYLNLSDDTERYQVTRAHILKGRYHNLVAAFDPRRLERFHASFEHKPIA